MNIAPFTGIPSYRQSAKPSFKARMRRLGIAPDVDTLLRGYLEETPKLNLFSNKIL